jgi:NADH dehydrogenase [ubiquinone] 1 alpha subcomplex assembly factor 7
MTERLDAFMARANALYYATRDPFADFTTAPEISQVFGELLGLWAAVVWQGMGSPDPVLLVEAGPGRGTLMVDALRAIRRMTPDFAAAVRLHLVENSPSLRAVQACKLDATWHDRLEDVPDGPMILLANEFLDALPIRQFVRRAAWCERYVDNGGFIERETDEALPDAPEGSVLERCEPALALARHLGQRLAAQGGAALFLDYGPEVSAFGDSLQALQSQANCDPLVEAGTADLTAHVDFQAFAEAAVGAAHFGPVPQGMFLARLGLFQRTGVLARTQQPEAAARMMQSARRLAEPDAMGRLFKVLAVCHPDLSQPPGFSE